MDNELKILLELSKKTALAALNKLKKMGEEGEKDYSFDKNIPKEMKATADTVIEKTILEHLTPTGIDILSEESGLLKGSEKSPFRFIIDPIDGTVNFVRGISDCSVSIALFDGNKAIFGVIASYPSGILSWGGESIGSFLEGSKLRVSTIENPLKGVLCTGFPSRFKFDAESMSLQMKLMSRFGKIRMLGAASQSLLQVAKGAVDCYSEKHIMLWDVAAGIAIVEGAGGKVMLTEEKYDYLLNVTACNAVIMEKGF